MIEVETIKSFSCDQCDYKAINKLELKKHIESKQEKLHVVESETEPETPID